MVKVTYVTHDGRAQEIDAREGISLMENAVAGGIEGIEAVCGGNAYCATCRVYPDPAWDTKLGERNDLEAPMLEEVGEAESNARLSCQIEVTAALEGLVVNLPESQT
ncbi:MAG: 2Fe-2S iron-sulfur cluster-binding protein [Sphingomonadaceae bacterium]|jgi:2Fe-2S ferredoxin